jgi:hypothetical protein
MVYPRTAGRMTVHATHPSFTAVRTDTVTAVQKEMVTLIVRMASSPIAIQPIVVTARSRIALNGFYERERRNAFGTFIDEKEIQRKRAVSVEQLMRGMAGLDVEQDPADMSKVLTLRGCTASIFVDGLPIPQGRGFDIDDLVPIGQLAAVEIYRSEAGVPFEFMNLGNACGSVVFWTHPIRDSMRATWKVGIAVAIIGAIVIAERAVARAQESNTTDRPMRDPAGWQAAGRRPAVRIQVPLPRF